MRSPDVIASRTPWRVARTTPSATRWPVLTSSPHVMRQVAARIITSSIAFAQPPCVLDGRVLDDDFPKPLLDPECRPRTSNVSFHRLRGARRVVEKQFAPERRRPVDDGLEYL